MFNSLFISCTFYLFYSTILNALRKAHPDWNYIDEPLDTWTSLKNEDGTNLLECFYSDQRRWSYTFQNCAVLSRFRNIEQAISNKANGISNVFITERCLDTDYHVFAKMLKDDKMIDAMEFSLYERWYALLKETATPLSAIIYIDTDPDTCAERIKGRGRNGEEGIPLDYLKKLTLFQNTWVDSLTAATNTTVRYVKSNENPSEFPCLRATTVDVIETFITNLVDTADLSRSNSLVNMSPTPFLSSALNKFTHNNKVANTNDNNELLVSAVTCE